MQGQGKIVVLTPLFRSVIITIPFALALVFYVSSDISFGQLFTPLPLISDKVRARFSDERRVGWDCKVQFALTLAFAALV